MILKIAKTQRKARRTRKLPKEEGWYSETSYGHFDKALTLEEAKLIVKDPQTVARHQFLPFLSTVTSIRKLSRAKANNPKTRKDRPLAYASHQDAAIFSYYNYELNKKYEKVIEGTHLSEAVLAYRKLGGRCNIHFAKEAFDEIRNKGSCVAVACDLQDFFETLGHKEIKAQWMRLLEGEPLPPDHFAVFKAITTYKVVKADEAIKTLGKKPYRERWWTSMQEIREKVLRKETGLTKPPHWKTLKDGERRTFGVPQGSPMSGFLANLVMLPFDEEMIKWAETNKGRYWRYSDDVLWVGPVGTEDAFLEHLEKHIGLAGEMLKLNADKTEITTFTPHGDDRQNACLRKRNGNKERVYEEGWLQYLGFIYDGNVVRIRNSSLAKYMRRMKGGAGAAIARTITHPNPKRLIEGGRQKVYERGLWEAYAYNPELKNMTFPKYVHKCASIFKGKDAEAMKAQIRRTPIILKNTLDISKRLFLKARRQERQRELTAEVRAKVFDNISKLRPRRVA